MAASYPGAIKTFTTLVDNVDDVLAEHQNQRGEEITAIENELGTNPKTIVDTVVPGASPTSVGQYLDMLAYHIKNMTGAANWNTVAPTIDDTEAPGASPASVAVYLSMLANHIKNITGAAAWNTVAPTIDDTEAPGASPASVAVYLSMLANHIKNMTGAANWNTVAPTIDDTEAPGAGPTSIGQYLSMVANIIKAITGQANWYSTPATYISNIADSRTFRSKLSSAITGKLLISGTAYWVYLGKTLVPVTPQFVEFYVNTAGAGAQTAEVGLFSTPSAPNKAGQTLTKLVATGTVDALTPAGLKGNTAAFATVIPAGTHLWAGIRTAMATTQPTILGLINDNNQGHVLSLAAAGALTGAGPWAGALLAASATVDVPNLTVTLD